jgi:hypothetical protein
MKLLREPRARAEILLAATAAAVFFLVNAWLSEIRPSLYVFTFGLFGVLLAFRLRRVHRQAAERLDAADVRAE